MTRNQRPVPKVGIVYLVGGKLWIDATPLAEAGRLGDFAIHERDHISYWAELVKSGRVEENDMTTSIVIAAILFVLYCFVAEWNCAGKNSPVIVTILCRLVARHIKLALKLFLRLIYFFGAISTVLLMQKDPRVVDSPQGHLANFVDRVTKPIQLVVDGIIGFLGIAAMIALLGSIALIKHVLLHRT